MSDSDRPADFETAQADNVHLGPAIMWLRTHTAFARLSNLELYEAFRRATVEGGFVVTFEGVSIP